MNAPVPYDSDELGIELAAPEKPLDLPVDKVKALAHAYMNTSQSVADIGITLGIPTAVVRAAIKQFGLAKAKEDAIAEARRAEAAAYADFLAKNRVPTAQQHLLISNQLVEVVGKLASKVGDPGAFDDPARMDSFVATCEELKKSIGTLRTLAEVLEKSSGVGARAVSLGGLDGNVGAAIARATEAQGRRPLVTFNLGAGAAAPRQLREADIIDGD